jgi:hypothetical protein
VVLGYMLSPVGAAAFSDRPGAADRAARHEPVFAAALLGTVLLGTLLILAGLLLPQLASRVS